MFNANYRACSAVFFSVSLTFTSHLIFLEVQKTADRSSTWRNKNVLRRHGHQNAVECPLLVSPA